MLLDTSGLYCFLDADDPLHGEAVSFLDRTDDRSPF
jgi:predicted nucleic acid-binding protein